MRNKYGNDFKNNIMMNREYPFIPEVTNSRGEVIHEGDNVIILESYRKRDDGCIFRGVVVKIYDAKNIVVYAETYRKFFSHCYISADDVKVELNCLNPFQLVDYDTECSVYNYFEHMIVRIYCRIYGHDITDDFIGEQLERDLARIKSQSHWSVLSTDTLFFCQRFLYLFFLYLYLVISLIS